MVRFRVSDVQSARNSRSLYRPWLGRHLLPTTMNVGSAAQFADRLVRRPPPGPAIRWRTVPWDWGANDEQACDPWDNKPGLRQWQSTRVLNIADGFYPSCDDMRDAVHRLLDRLANEPVPPVAGDNALSRGPLRGHRDFVQFIVWITFTRHGVQEEQRNCTHLFHPWPAGQAPQIGAGQEWEQQVENVCSVNIVNESKAPNVPNAGAHDAPFDDMQANDAQINRIKFAVRAARHPLQGGAWVSMEGAAQFDSVKEVLLKSKSTISIQNKDNLCLFRAVGALLLRGKHDSMRGEYNPARQPGARGYTTVKLNQAAHAFVDGQMSDMLKKRKGVHKGKELNFEALSQQCNKGRPVQTQVARWLASKAGWALNPAKPGLAEIQKLEGVIGQSIAVFDYDNALVRSYAGNPDYPGDPLYLLLSTEHYWAVTSITGVLRRGYYCHDCDARFDSLHAHRTCTLTCPCCKYTPRDNGGKPCDTVVKRKANAGVVGAQTTCRDCNQRFDTPACMANHRKPHKPKEGTRTRCETYRSCGPNCSKFSLVWYEETEAEHRCKDQWCTNCKEVYNEALDGPHRCFMSPLTLKVRSEKHIIYDFECEQRSHDGVHTITHVAATYLSDEGSDCVKVWEPDADGDSSKVADSFFKWLFGGKRHGRGWTAWAHNARGYDSQFVLRYALEHNLKVQHVVRSGAKLMAMVVEGVRFYCSLSHLTCSLAQIPAIFGLGEEVRKGHFPHRMSADGPEVQNYVGPIPARDQFFLDNLSRKDKEEFDEWYAGWEGRQDWSFRDEMRAYVVQDVVVLREGLKAYQQSFTFESPGDGSGVEGHEAEPLGHPTIASVVHSIYRSCFMPENTIPLLTQDEADFVREGFFGGRVAVFQPHVKCKPGEKILYDDVTSLYPSVNACVMPEQEYPVGAPVWVHEPPSIDGLRGFAMVDVQPPPGLIYHPLLPEKSGGTLSFDLKPKVKAVYATCELQEALRQGYVITKVWKVLHFAHASKDLFADYVNQFMIKKDQATAEGNAGARAVAKLALNSLWGRLGMSEGKSKSAFVTTVGEAVAMCEDKLVTDIITRGCGNYLEVVYKEKEREVEVSRSTCVALAAWTTAMARLVLYKRLMQAGNRAIYADTDSLIYLKRPGDPELPIGKGLGMWAPELNEDDWIGEVACLGAKLYAYRTAVKGKLVVRCKGFRRGALNTEAALCIDNFIRAINSVKRKSAFVDAVDMDAELQEGQYYGNIKDTQLVRTHDRRIISKPIVKKLRPTLENKGHIRTVDGSMRIMPFGAGEGANRL